MYIVMLKASFECTVSFVVDPPGHKWRRAICFRQFILTGGLHHIKKSDKFGVEIGIEVGMT